jgi:hypothetical protein
VGGGGGPAHEALRLKVAVDGLGPRTSQVRDRTGEIATEDDIACTGIGARFPIRGIGADHQVRETIAIDVARRGDRIPGIVAGRQAIQLESGCPVELREIDVGEAAAMAVDHIGRAVAMVAAGIRRADQQIGIAVAVDVTGRGDRKTGIVAHIGAMDCEALRRRQRGEIDIGEIAGAEQYVGRAGAVSRRRARWARPDDDVAVPIAIDVPGR